MTSKRKQNQVLPHALTEMEYNPREPKNPTNKACETEAVKVSSSNIHMNKSAEAYESLPPKESDQKYTVEELNLRHQLGSAPDVADNAGANELGSRKMNLEDDYNLTMVVSDENANEEKSVLVSSDDNGKICTSSGRIQLGSDNPSGLTSFDNIII